jgi:general secretion pathway protein A
MYYQFYGLKSAPFNITSDPSFFFESYSHREALSALLYGIEEKKGIILLTGEVGTGKTTLCKYVLRKLNQSVKSSFIDNPYFSDVQLLQAIVEDFGLRIEKKNKLDIIKVLNSFLIDINLKGGNSVLMIDEAQNLTSRQLEQIRLLSNLETSQEKLLQIILVGQPELIEKLNNFKLRQIRQRIFVKHIVTPLKENEIEDYVNLRLKVTGEGNFQILPDSYRTIYEFSKGIPRLINLLCDRTFLIGYLREKKIYDEEIFRESIKEIL